jgi:hypothetical protein
LMHGTPMKYVDILFPFATSYLRVAAFSTTHTHTHTKRSQIIGRHSVLLIVRWG